MTAQKEKLVTRALFYSLYPQCLSMAPCWAAARRWSKKGFETKALNLRLAARVRVCFGA
jgi:hypothetical protein